MLHIPTRGKLLWSAWTVTLWGYFGWQYTLDVEEIQKPNYRVFQKNCMNRNLNFGYKYVNFNIFIRKVSAWEISPEPFFENATLI